MNKNAGFSDLFIFIIFALILVVMIGVFLYISDTTTNLLRLKIPELELEGVNNASQIFEDTMGQSQASFTALYWITSLIIFGMILSIFIGSYMVTTRPVFFIPHVILTIIAVIVSAGISNAYETISQDATLSSTFSLMTGANWVMLKLPIVVAIVGIGGAIIMFSRLGKQEVYYSPYG